MLYTQFPGTGLKPSVLCLGTSSFGSAICETDALEMLDIFAEAGGNFADSAHIYAAWLPGGAGASERTLGKWLASRRPGRFIVSTKGGHPDLETMQVSRLRPDCIARDVEESLERLGVETIDLYWLHRDDESVPAAEIMDALQPHVAAGRVRYPGASNWSAARIEEANQAAGRRGWRGFCASQVGWSLAEVNAAVRGQNGMLYMDDDTLRWHRETGFPAVAYSSQAGGFFARELPPETGGDEKQQTLARYYGSRKNAGRHVRARMLGEGIGHGMNAVALSWIWSQSFPGVAIVGCRDARQLRVTLAASDVRLDAGQTEFLEQGQLARKDVAQ